jgi:cardiolipin synthase
MGSALGAALTSRRVLETGEAGTLAKVGLTVIALAIVAAWWPAVVGWPLAFVGAWLGLAWLGKAFVLRRKRKAHDQPAATRPGEPRESGDADA